MNNLTFQRPSGGFSDKLTSEIVQQKHEDQEKKVYEKKKKEIQNYVLKYFNEMSWEFDTQNIGHSTLSKLQSKMTKRGFSCKHMKAEYCPGGMGDHGGFTKPKLTVSLTENPIEEDDGYFSDGWEPKFKASEIKNKIQESLNKQYQELTSKIEATILKYPGYHEYTLKPNSISPIVMGWVKESLEERGLIVKHLNEMCPSDIGGSYTEFTNYWKIINPKINNYRSTEIYL